MRCEYTIEIECNCPVNGERDVYQVTLVSHEKILVEDIIEYMGRFSNETVFQEDLTQKIAKDFNCETTSIGSHSGVITKVTCLA